MERLIYCTLKDFERKTLRKKFSGNTHLFYIPYKNDYHLYLILLGRIGNKNISPKSKVREYLTVQLNLLPTEMLDEFIERQKQRFGKDYNVIERLKGEYSNDRIKILKGGDYIKSDLEIQFLPKNSRLDRKLFILKGFLNFLLEEFNLNDKNFNQKISKINFKRLA